MRYIKVFLLVLLFFLVMMLFVQNQASFSDSVTLTFDPMFAPAVSSAPIPRYALLLISFALGAAVVLLMLLWDRMALAGRASSARRRAASLQKQLDKLTAAKQKVEETLKETEARAEASEARAKEAEARAKEAEARAKDAEARAEAAEAAAAQNAAE